MKKLIDEQTKIRWNKLAGLNEAIEIDSDLDFAIKEYTTMQSKIDEEQQKIQNIIDSISNMEKENKSRFKDIETYMKRFNIDEKRVDSWLAKLEESLKYKVPRPDYKELWLNALDKVNEATKRVMEELKNAQLEFKKSEKEIKLNIKQEGIGDIFKTLFLKIKKLFLSFNLFNRAANKLPKIK